MYEMLINSISWGAKECQCSHQNAFLPPKKGFLRKVPRSCHLVERALAGQGLDELPLLWVVADLGQKRFQIRAREL